MSWFHSVPNVALLSRKDTSITAAVCRRERIFPRGAPMSSHRIKTWDLFQEFDSRIIL